MCRHCRPYIDINNQQGMQLDRFKNCTPAHFEYIYCTLFPFKLGYVSIPKRHIFLPLFLFCAYDSSVLHYLNFWNFSDPIVEVNAVVRHFVIRGSLCEIFGNKCVKILKFWRTELSYAQNKNRGNKVRLIGMDTCPSLNDIMKIRYNKCTRGDQGYDF